jgi:hygromycin-B 4-O-kinase
MRPHVEEFLRHHVGQVEAIEAVGHGEWSRAYFFRHDGRELVVRFSATDDDFLKDLRARQMAAALPIPELLEFGEAEGGYFAISQRVHGTFLEERDAAEMRAVLPALLSTLDAFREVDVSSSHGFGLWRGSDGDAPYATWRQALLNVATSPRITGWQEALKASAESQKTFDRAFAELERLVDACPEERRLVHSDMLNFNVLVEQQQITAVLDWGSALYGDFVWDLAWFTFWQPWYSAWSTLDIRQAARAHYAAIGLAVPNFDERLRCCELAIGMDGLAYQAWARRQPENLAWTTRRLQTLIG